MADQRINVTLSASDLISPEIARIRANIDAMGARARVSVSANDLRRLTLEESTHLQGTINELQGVEPSSGQGLFSSVLFGNLGAAAISAGITLVGNAISGITSKINEAARSQTMAIAQSGDLAQQMGVSFTNAQKIVNDTQIDISKMAASLPGENKDFANIYSQVSGSIARLSGGDVDKYKKDSMSLTERYGVLSSVKGLDAGQSGAALDRALNGGSGLSEVFQIDIFQKNEPIRRAIDEQLKSLGKSREDWKKLTLEQRFTILDAAGKIAVTDDTIKAFGGTVESMVQEVKSKLFDERSGLIGFLRVVSEAGDRSALDAAQGAMQSLGSLFNTLGILKGNKVLGIDPMEGLIKVIDWFSLLTSTSGQLLSGSQGSVAGMFTDLASNVYQGLFGMMNSFGDFLGNANWSKVGEDMGYVIGKVFTMIFTRFDVGAVLGFLGKGLSALWQVTTGFIVGAVKGNLEELGSTFQRLIRAIGESIGKLIKSVVSWTTNPVGNIIESSVGTATGISGVAVGAGNGVRTGVGNFLDLLNPLSPNSIGQRIMGKPSAPLPSVKTAPKGKEVAFAPVVNVTGSNDPQTTADKIMEVINSAYINYQANNLATG
jgi:hypothetical protein